MPSYKELMKLIRQGKSPAEILEEMPMPPSRLRRMLNGKRMQALLKLEEEIAAELVCHNTATGIFAVAERLNELTKAQNAETARKVCLALLGEGLRNAEGDQPTEQAAAGPPPWKLLEPQANPSPAEAAEAEGDG